MIMDHCPAHRIIVTDEEENFLYTLQDSVFVLQDKSDGPVNIYTSAKRQQIRTVISNTLTLRITILLRLRGSR